MAQLADKAEKIKQMEESMVKKEEFRRISLEVQDKEFQKKVDKLMTDTKEKLDYLQQLKANEIQC